MRSTNEPQLSNLRCLQHQQTTTWWLGIRQSVTIWEFPCPVRQFRTMMKDFKKAKLPADWLDAFDCLKQFIQKIKVSKKKKVIFIDELPWFDTARSRFIQALEHFWNSWAASRKDVLLIVCGSAASWMLNTLINSRGGLHNRVTQRICCTTFTNINWNILICFWFRWT